MKFNNIEYFFTKYFYTFLKYFYTFSKYYNLALLKTDIA